MKTPNTCLKKAVAVLRPIRPFIERPKGSEYFFYLAALFGVGLIIQVLVSSQWNEISEGLLATVAITSGVGFIVEMQSQVRAALASIWARALGKAMFGVLALLVNYFATSLAKHFAHLVAHVDPKFFPEFTGIVGIGIAALLFLVAIQFVVSLLGLLRLLSSYLVLAGSFAPKALGFAWRVMFGKRTRFIGLKHSLFATFSFIGSISLGVALAYPAMLLARHSENVSSILTKILVVVEYRSGASCANLLPNMRIAYLDRGWVSIVEPTPEGFRFSQAQCIYAANPAVEGTLRDKAAQRPSP